MLTPTLRTILTKGQAAMNLRLDRQGTTPEAQRVLARSLLWSLLSDRIDTAAIAGDVDALKAAYRLAWTIADGPTTAPGKPS